MAYDGSIRIDTSIDPKGFRSGVKKLNTLASDALKGITTLIAGAGAALSAGAIAGVKYNAQMEQYITSFGTMLGSAEKAQNMISQIKKFAAETPFELPDLAKGAQTLLAFGTAEEKVLPIMKMLGDVSQGNKEKFDGLTLAFAQCQSTGKLMGQDLLQMINQGFNPLNEISKMTGKSVAQLKEEMSKGAISAEMVAAAFEHATSEGGQFYNAMEAQSKTFSGQLSTLKDNVSSFIGELTEGLTDSLKDSALPMVNGWLNDLQNAFKAGGPAALTKAFGSVLAEAVTAVAQEAPGVIESSSKIVKSFIVGIRQNLPSLTISAAEIVSTLVKGVADIFPREISQPIKQAMDDILKSFKSGGLRTAINVLKKLLSSFSNTAGKLAKSVLPVLTKAIDKLADASDILIPTATLVTAAITAWKVAQQAKTWLDVASKAVTAFTSANTASAAACGAATASVTLGQFAYGILTGNISLATAAQTIFNSVLNANPIGLVITAVTALGAGLVVLNNLLDTGQERAKRLDAAFASMGDGASKFQAGLETAQSRLSEFNAELFASSEEQADLQTNMQEVQNGITSICRLATEERRAYTEAEIIQLNEYFQRLDELSARQFEIEALRMDAISQQAVAEAEMHKGSLAEYQATAQQWIATAREQRDNQISLAQEQCTQKLALLAEEYKGSSVMTNQAYADEYNAAIKARDENIRVANEAVGGIVAAYTDGYAKRSGLVGLENQLTVTANQSLLSEQQRHVAEMQRIDDDYTLNEKQKQMKRSQETKLHEENMSKIWDDLTKNMTDEQKEQLGVYLDLVAQTELYGGQIEDATEQTAAGIVASFDNLPDDMRDAMSNALTPMLDEMERMEPVLYAKAESIANGILSRLRRAFQEKSPSRATRKIFRYVMQGGELGLDDEEPKLLNMAEDIGTSFIARMRDAVQTRRNLFSARFAAQGDYSAFRAQATQPALAGGTVTNLYQTINTHDSLSESELTREAENLLERSRWKNP